MSVLTILLALSIAPLAGTVLYLSKQLRAERHARQDAERAVILDMAERKIADRRIESVLEASRVLTSSLEYDRTLQEFARFVASRLADMCVIVLREEDQFKIITAAHRLPEKQEILS